MWRPLANKFEVTLQNIIISVSLQGFFVLFACKKCVYKIWLTLQFNYVNKIFKAKCCQRSTAIYFITDNLAKVCVWFCGVTVSTLDSESSNPSSNLGRTFNFFLRIVFEIKITSFGLPTPSYRPS